MSFEISPAHEAGVDNLDWLEPFEWEEPPEWHETLDLLELAEQMIKDARIESGLWLLYNRQKAQRLHGWQQAHTVPAAEHYRHTYLWDTGFFMIILSQAGLYADQAAQYLKSRIDSFQTAENQQKIRSAIDKLLEYGQEFKRAAKEDSFWVVKSQRPDGFIPGTQYAGGWRFYEVEKGLSIDRVNKSTNYSQPPNLPLGAMSVYKSLKESNDPEAIIYLQEVYYYLNRFLEFFEEKRRNSREDPLIGVPDPHETGQDSAARWDHTKPNRRPRQGPDTDPELDDDNRYIDGTHAVMRQLDTFLWARDKPERQRRLFWENDVSMNAIYFHNLQVMNWLSQEIADQTQNPQYLAQAAKFRGRANDLGQAIRQRMWITNLDPVPQKGFYNLKADGQPNPDISPNNIFALVLPDLSEEQLTAVLDMMDEHFDVPYPFPSASTKSPNYDPHNQEQDRLWRGPTWINTNYYIVEFGLRLHARRTDDIDESLRWRCGSWADRVAIASNELIDLNHPEELTAQSALELIENCSDEELQTLTIITGASEHFHPHKGRGQRSRVKNFGWTWLARFMRRPGRSADTKSPTPKRGLEDPFSRSARQD